MGGERVRFPDGQVIELLARTVAAIAEARAKYAAPLWQFRPEALCEAGRRCIQADACPVPEG